MESGANPVAGLLGFWMLVRLVSLLGAVAGGLYALYCLSRVAAASERTAAALEMIAAQGAFSANSPDSQAPRYSPPDYTPPAYSPPNFVAPEVQPFTPPIPAQAPQMPPQMAQETPIPVAAVSDVTRGHGDV